MVAEPAPAPRRIAPVPLSRRTLATLGRMLRGDEWLKERYQAVTREVPGLREMERPWDHVVPFWMDGVKRANGTWDAKGVGVVVTPPEDYPWPTLAVGDAIGTLAAPREGTERMYQVIEWLDGLVTVVQMWDMLLSREGTEAVAHVAWRPGYAEPVLQTIWKADPGRARRDRAFRERFEQDAWSFLEEGAQPGRKRLEESDDWPTVVAVAEKALGLRRKHSYLTYELIAKHHLEGVGVPLLKKYVARYRAWKQAPKT